MSADLDFSRFHLKVNAAGSWANVGRFDVLLYDEVKAHCLALALLSIGTIKFRLLDDAGGTLEILDSHHGQPGWRELNDG